MKNKITLYSLGLLLTLFCVSIFSVPQVSAAEAIGETIKSEICFVPSVSIPGMDSFLDSCTRGGKTGYAIGADTIGKYISGLYRYVAGVAGVVAMFMIVFAAWQWVMASGNAGKIDNAKDTIRGALVGLALVFGGFILMNSISSQLVNFDSLKIAPIKTEIPEPETCDLADVNQAVACVPVGLVGENCGFYISPDTCNGQHVSNNITCRWQADDTNFYICGGVCVPNNVVTATHPCGGYDTSGRKHSFE